MFRNGEKDRQHAPALLYIDHLDAPFPGIPAPRGKERRPPNQLHGVTVCRPKIVKFHAFRVRHLLAASACEMEMVARHQRHPGLARKEPRPKARNTRDKGLRIVNADAARTWATC